MIRVLLADDHPVVRAGLRALLTGEPGIAVIGEAATADEAVSAAARDRPDVVLMDLQFGGALTGADATRRIRSGDTGTVRTDLDPPPAFWSSPTTTPTPTSWAPSRPAPAAIC